MDNTNTALIAQRLRSFAESQWMDFDAPDSAAMLNEAAEALEAAEAALKFKQGLIEDISRDCERAEAELTRLRELWRRTEPECKENAHG
jgi:hypothetical protein